MRNLNKYVAACAGLIFGMFASFAQEIPMQTLPLDELSSFQEQAGNWFIVGDITMTPVMVEDKKERKRKAKKEKNSSQGIEYEPGEGILLNVNSEGKNSPLVTNWEHGDIDMTMEVMLPSGSNSGIYLQGRYEVQLFDSWGTENAKFSDMGGIYRNWENEPDKKYLGKAPLVNAAKAPGLWQTLKISFRAPRFNADNEKISNARFASVELNGIKIHDNIEVPLPTGGPIKNNEEATGPIMIQGDHGPVAFRNIRYRLLKDSKVELNEIDYKVFFGEFVGMDDFEKSVPVAQGTLSELTWQVVEKDTAFAISYSGSMEIPEDDTYEFSLTANNRAQLHVNNQEVVSGGERANTGKVALEKGSVPFNLKFYSGDSWTAPRLGLTVRGSGTNEKDLHTYGSFPPNLDMVSPIHVKVGGEPQLLRAFLDFKGDYNQRLTHTIAVGDPGGVHYIYDLNTGNLASVWRGQFIDATSMWYSRGDGSFEPLGLQQNLFVGPALIALNDENAAFPVESNVEAFRNHGYKIDEASGRPTFKYSYKGMEVSDKIYPDEENKMLFREVTVQNNKNGERLYFKVAEGETITPMNDGSYVIGEEYYVKILSSHRPEIRETNGKKEMILALNDTPVKYSLIW